MSHKLSDELQSAGLTDLAKYAEVLEGERDAALLDAWKSRETNRKLQARLRKLISAPKLRDL